MAPASIRLDVVASSDPVKGNDMNSDTKKLVSATLLFLLWAATIVGKHFWADLQIEGIQQAISLSLIGLGVYHITSTNQSSTGA